MFKVGDKVRCIDTDGVSDYLKNNQEHKIIKISEDKYYIFLEGVNGYICSERFELVNRKRYFILSKLSEEFSSVEDALRFAGQSGYKNFYVTELVNEYKRSEEYVVV